LFTNRKIPPGERQHVLDAMMGFARTLGVATEGPPRWDIPLPAEAVRFAESHLPGDTPTLVISPCSSARFRNFRNWAAERYAAVVNHAVEKHGMRVVLTGGPTALEREYGARISAMAQHPMLNLIGQSNLKELLAVLQRATALISPDSGPAHMATAAGCPVIGLYATSNPLRTGPYLSQQYVVNKYPEAVQREFGKDVSQVAWGQRVRRADAMELIGVGEVCRMLDRVLDERLKS
jgi:heptosyltransferase I